ncbi:MAG: FecR family protein [Flammeovirgaceae bacterium]
MMERPAYHIIHKHFKGEASEAEQRQVAAWVNEAEANANEYAMLQAIWQAYGKHHELYVPNKRFALQHISKRLTSIDYKHWPYLKIAASLAVMLLVGTLVYFSQYSRQKNTLSYAATTESKEVWLTDGSKVTLRKGAKITLDHQFNASDRNVVLEGSALFAVAKNKAKPFQVTSGKIEIKVVGTSFLVSPQKTHTEVAVVEGIVEVGSPNQRIRLTKNQIAIYQPAQDSLTKLAFTRNNLLSWQTQHFLFKQETLENVVLALSHHFQVSIEVSDQVAHKLLNAEFQEQSLDEILAVICSTHQLKIQKLNNKLYLIRNE